MIKGLAGAPVEMERPCKRPAKCARQINSQDNAAAIGTPAEVGLSNTAVLDRLNFFPGMIYRKYTCV